MYGIILRKRKTKKNTWFFPVGKTVIPYLNPDFCLPHLNKTYGCKISKRTYRIYERGCWRMNGFIINTISGILPP